MISPQGGDQYLGLDFSGSNWDRTGSKVPGTELQGVLPDVRLRAEIYCAVIDTMPNLGREELRALVESKYQSALATRDQGARYVS